MRRLLPRVLPETALALLVGLLVLADPVRVPLMDPDEGRYAEIPREMLVSGDFVIPHQDGLVYLEKPPLSYWLVAGSYGLFGETEGAARLPGKLATLGTMLALFLFARRRAGERAGALAAFFFGGSLLGFGLARIVLIDPLLSAAQTAAVLAFAALAEGGSGRARERGLAVAFAIAAAAAVLLKGLVGVLLPGGAVVLWSLATGSWRPFRRLLGPLPILAFLLLAVPWHVAAALREPEFLRFYFVREHFERFLLPNHHRPGPAWYFLAVVAGGFLPFTPLLPRLRAAWPGRRRAAWAARPLEGFLFVWVLLVVVFFSLSKSKLIPYVHPAFPSLSLLLALAVARDEKGLELRPAERLSIAGLVGILGAAAAWIGAVDVSAIPGLADPALVLSGALLVGFLLVGSGPTLAPERGLHLAGVAWVLFLGASLFVLPAYARWDGAWPIAEAVAATRRPGDLLVQRGDYVESLPFYARQVTPLSRIGAGSELTFGRGLDRTGIFQTDEEFTRLWNGPRRVLAVLRRDVLREWAEPGSRRRPYAILATAHEDRFVLVSNDPGRLVAPGGGRDRRGGARDPLRTAELTAASPDPSPRP
jgi:4-amino-4-deoxy-L-arabinose transferase-like glycosyltransferase